MSKINCNKLSIGQPGTEHIRWVSADTFIRENGAKRLETVLARFKFGPIKRSKSNK